MAGLALAPEVVVAEEAVPAAEVAVEEEVAVVAVEEVSAPALDPRR